MAHIWRKSTGSETSTLSPGLNPLYRVCRTISSNIEHQRKKIQNTASGHAQPSVSNVLAWIPSTDTYELTRIILSTVCMKMDITAGCKSWKTSCLQVARLSCCLLLLQVFQLKKMEGYLIQSIWLPNSHRTRMSAWPPCLRLILSKVGPTTLMIQVWSNSPSISGIKWSTLSLTYWSSDCWHLVQDVPDCFTSLFGM